MNRLRMLKIATFCTVLGVSAVAAAQFKSIGGSKVQFLAVGPAGLKINGQTAALSAAEGSGDLTVKAKLTDLKTGIGLRDKHLRNYLETDKYPEATLTVKREKLKVPADNETVTSTGSAKFTLHGVTKPVKFEYKAKRTGSDFHIQGMTQIDIRDFKVKVPCYLGVCVEPEVQIKVKFKLRDS